MMSFLSAANGIVLIPSFILIVFLVQGSQVMSSYWYVRSFRSIRIIR